MRRLAVLVIILSCAAPASASAHNDDPRCERAQELTARAIEQQAAAQKAYNRAKNKLRNAHGKKKRKAAKKAKNRAKNVLDEKKGGVAARKRLQERYCSGGGGRERPTKRG
jgi:hypothetical protein